LLKRFCPAAQQSEEESKAHSIDTSLNGEFQMLLPPPPPTGDEWQRELKRVGIISLNISATFGEIVKFGGSMDKCFSPRGGAGYQTSGRITGSKGSKHDDLSRSMGVGWIRSK
jgi:hypothetical protein